MVGCYGQCWSADAGVQQHAEVELALMHAISAMAHDAASLPYVTRVLDQLCPPGKHLQYSFSCLLKISESPLLCL